MKNKNIRTSLFIFVIFLSLCSHTYLNSVTVPSEVEIEKTEMNEVNFQNESSLPDVKIVEKAVDFIKNMLPISQ